MLQGRSVLIVEDEFLIADMLSDMVADMGMIVCGVADTADGAVMSAAQALPDVVLMDVRLKGQKDGVDAALAIYGARACPVVFITGSREPATVQRIRNDHPAALLFKPLNQSALRLVLEKLLQ